MLDRDSYEETRLALLGRKPLSATAQAMVDWARKEFGVAVLNVRHGGIGWMRRTPSLLVVVDTMKDAWALNGGGVSPCDPVIRQKILAKLAELSGARGSAMKDLFVAVTPFAPDAIERAHQSVSEEARVELAARFGLWLLFKNPPIFFFHTAKQRQEKLADGSCARLDAEYFALVKAGDELGYIKREEFNARFDDKESLDRHHGGDLRRYFGG
jgi:hypothetical protein